MRIFVFIALLAAIILLQVYLSKKENKWFGLVMPIICFLFALIVVPLNMLASTSGIDMKYIVKHTGMDKVWKKTTIRI